MLPSRIHQVPCCSCRMEDVVKEQLRQLNHEIAELAGEIKAAAQKLVEARGAQQERRFNKILDIFAKREALLFEERQALEAKLSRAGEHTLLLACCHSLRPTSTKAFQPPYSSYWQPPYKCSACLTGA